MLFSVLFENINFQIESSRDFLKWTQRYNMNRGSEWRIWDLHVHTPLSIENNYGCTNDEDGWNKYITALEQLPPDIKVLGINDYPSSG